MHELTLDLAELYKHDQMCFSIYTIGATIGAETAYPSGAHMSSPTVLVGFLMLSCFVCPCWPMYCLSFLDLWLLICYPFGIFKLFLEIFQQRIYFIMFINGSVGSMVAI